MRDGYEVDHRTVQVTIVYIHTVHVEGRITGSMKWHARMYGKFILSRRALHMGIK